MNCRLLTIERLDVGYPMRDSHRVVLRQLSAQLSRGELVCLVGRNGSGKSTLLRTLAALQSPLKGDVSLDGTPLGSYSPEEIARRVGVVLTARPELPQTTVRELVAYGRLPYARLLHVATAEDRQQVAEALEVVGISDLADRRLTTLSDGELQKVMIAKTLAQGTDLILLDEPSAFLDYPAKRRLMQLLQRLAHEQQKSILLSTHDLQWVRPYADRVWWLHDGTLQVLAPTDFDPETV